MTSMARAIYLVLYITQRLETHLVSPRALTRVDCRYGSLTMVSSHKAHPSIVLRIVQCYVESRHCGGWNALLVRAR